jgi:FAD/FMN-containing dehydrogenase
LVAGRSIGATGAKGIRATGAQKVGGSLIFGRNVVNGHHFILVGLSTDNLKKIRNGKELSLGPVKNDPLLENATIIIMAGTTEEEIVEKLKKAGLVPPS